MTKQKEEMETIEDATLHNLADWLGVNSEDWFGKKWDHIIWPVGPDPKGILVRIDEGKMTISRPKV